MQTELNLKNEGNDSLVHFPRTSRHFITVGDSTPIHNEVVMFCENCHEYSIVYLECGDRTCYSCNKKRQRRIRRRYHDLIVKMENPKFLTLTLKRATLSKAAVQNLRVSFTKLRHRKIWKARGGIYQIEIGTINGNTANLHIHAIIDSQHMDKDQLQQNWKQITGYSYIVHIETCFSPRGALKYLTTHMGKRIGRPEDRELVNEVLAGTRLVQGFGEFTHESMAFRISICENCGAENSLRLDFEILPYDPTPLPAGF